MPKLTDRKITYAQAIAEATAQCMEIDSSVYIMGLGVPDPKGIFGTTLGLKEKFGDERVLDMPVSENAMTGVVIGSALVGMRPIMTHQRIDFMLLALDQIINNASKWHYMFGGKMNVPLVIRLLVGRGWGQGPQHSQSLQSLFAHIPGLKVVMPATAYDAKGLFISSVEDNNPVIFIENRWLHGVYGEVPQEMYRVPLGKGRIMRPGKDLTIAVSSYMTLMAIKAACMLKEDGIDAEVVDLRSIKPIDEELLFDSVKKTGRLIVLDGGWRSFGVSAEIIALVTEEIFGALKSSPVRLAFPDLPAPTSWALANHYYPDLKSLINAARQMFGLKTKSDNELGIRRDIPLDVPDKSFSGPF